jgi:hypothetical protein
MVFKWGKNEVFAASFFRLIFGRKISPQSSATFGAASSKLHRDDTLFFEKSIVPAKAGNRNRNFEF